MRSFVHSSYVYQGLGRGLGLDKIVQLNRIAVGEYMPEFTVFLDLSPEQAFMRKGGADKTDRLERENLDFFNRVYDGFKTMCADGDLVPIDGSGEKEQTAANILQAVRRIL